MPAFTQSRKYVVNALKRPLRLACRLRSLACRDRQRLLDREAAKDAPPLWNKRDAALRDPFGRKTRDDIVVKENSAPDRWSEPDDGTHKRSLADAIAAQHRHCLAWRDCE